jgi:hypothetical protein
VAAAPARELALMPELIGDAALYQNPIEGAAQTYALTPPAEGAGGAMGAEIETGPAAYLARAAERGAYAGASPFARALAVTGLGLAGEAIPEPIESPVMQPEEYNRLYAPEGTSLGDKPMPEELAKVLGKQKADQLQRDSILSRYNANAGLVTSFATETLASFADPLNFSTLFLPGLTGEALASRIGAGLAGRTALRLGAGAATGAAQQAPLSALRYGLSQDEFADYSLHDAFRDIAFGAAGAAIINAGIVGGASEFLRWRRGQGSLPAGADAQHAADAARVLNATALTDHAAMRAATGEILDGRSVDVDSFFYQPPRTETAIGTTVAAPEIAPTPVRSADIEAAARSLAPEDFAKRDRLLAQQEKLRQQIAAPESHPDITAIDESLGQLRQERSTARAAGDRRRLADQVSQLETQRATLLEKLPGELREQSAQADYALRDLVRPLAAARADAERNLALVRPAVPSAQDTLMALQDALDRQRNLARDGHAPGMSQPELSRATEAVYPSEPGPGLAAKAPPERAGGRKPISAPGAAAAPPPPAAAPAQPAPLALEEGGKPVSAAAVAAGPETRAPAAPPRPAPAVATAPIVSSIANDVQSFRPGELTVDARRFQFKEGGNEAGVTERLTGVERWDPIKSGMTVVYEDHDGARYIVDGHQRLSLAKRIAEADPAQDPRLTAYVLRAADGVTDAEARAAAAAKNIAEGTGSAVDAAKVLRDRLIRDLPPRSELVRQARGLVALDDNGFGLVVNEVVPANYAAIVGRLVPEDARMQNMMLELLAKTEPENAVQAEAIVRQGIGAGVHVETQAGLFGAQEIATSLYLDRAKILDRALKQLRRDRKVFDALVSEHEIVAEVGNVLAHDTNVRRATSDGQAIQILQVLAGRKGPVSDALGAAARSARDTGNHAAATRDFVAALRREVESGDLARLANGIERGRGDAGGEGRGLPAAERVEPGGAVTPAAEAQAGQRAKEIIERTAQGEQRVMPGMERSAVQAAAGREAEGHGRIGSAAPQQEAGGLFERAEAPQPGLFGAGVDHELAAAEGAAAGVDHAALLPEERSELAATGRAVAEAGEIEAGMAEAAACIAGGTVGSA